MAVAIALIAIALTAFWARERWAWWTLLVGHTIALGAPMAYDQLSGAIGVFEFGEWVCPGGGVRGTGLYLALLNKDKVVPVEQSVEQDVFSDAS